MCWKFNSGAVQGDASFEEGEMKKHYGVIFFILLIPALLHAQPVSYQATTANIAAWNIAGFDAIPTHKSKIFANAISYIDPEVIALVEVNPDSIADNIVSELKSIGICYDKAMLKQSAEQNIAVLYKCDVQLTNPRLIDDSDNNNRYLRKAFAADVRIGSFDFILIVLHLKAGRGGIARSVRDDQARTIASFIQSETQNEEKDVLIVGDYNMIPIDDQSNFSNMNPDNYLLFVSDELSDQHTHISSSGPGNLLDGYAISNEHTIEHIKGSIRTIKLYEILDKAVMDYRENISDHLPVEASFRIIEDDD